MSIIITVVIVVFILILLLRMRVRMKTDVLEMGPVTIQQQDLSRSVSPISPSLPPIKRPSQRTLNMTTAQRLDANWEVDFADLIMKERLGLGAFGEVWRAEVSDDPSQEKPTVVAVKVTKGQRYSQCAPPSRILSFFVTVNFMHAPPGALPPPRDHMVTSCMYTRPSRRKWCGQCGYGPAPLFIERVFFNACVHEYHQLSHAHMSMPGTYAYMLSYNYAKEESKILVQL